MSFGWQWGTAKVALSKVEGAISNPLLKASLMLASQETIQLSPAQSGGRCEWKMGNLIILEGQLNCSWNKYNLHKEERVCGLTVGMYVDMQVDACYFLQFRIQTKTRQTELGISQKWDTVIIIQFNHLHYIYNLSLNHLKNSWTKWSVYIYIYIYW